MIHIAYPWILLLLPLPFIVYRFVPKGEAMTSSALRIPFYSELRTATGNISPDRAPLNWRVSLVFVTWCLFVLAAAKPIWLGPPVHLPRAGRDIMLAVDISGSMQIPDMQWHGKKVNRLTVVKEVAGEFIKSREGDRLGLILFGTKAYLQTPLTYDRTTVINMLDDSSIGLAGQETALGDALGLATKRLLKESDKNRILVLLTDGASNTGTVDPVSAAMLAKKYNIRIYTIGLGSDRMLITTAFGQQVLNPSRSLDETTLKKIAELTGGEFFRAKDSEGLQKIYRRIDRIEPTVTDEAIFRPITPLYQWPLFVAMLCTLLLMSRQINFIELIQRKVRGVA